jgi:uncharacterized membrane protein
MTMGNFQSDWHQGWGGGDWVGMLLMMILVWTPILLLGFFVLRAAAGPRGGSTAARDEAEEDARRSYARGEMDRERFQQVMQDLREHRGSSS